MRAGTTEQWDGVATTSLQPPEDYWRSLTGLPHQIAEAKKLLADTRQNQCTPASLPPPRTDATSLLEQVSDDGWLQREERLACPNCDEQVTKAEAASGTCPYCDQAYADVGGVQGEEIFTRHLAPGRDVAWVVAVHGMATRGAWQEEFSWYFSTTWGRAVPVAVYKYGIVTAGVLMPWHRRTLQRRLRAKLATLQDQARSHGFQGKPDLVAHSFGTWLVAHLLNQEQQRSPEERLTFGRVILTGSIIRPDYDWHSIQEAGIVEAVMNHYATGDRIVPLAHYTIWNSGPSGQRGFDGDATINVAARGYGHRDVLSTRSCLTRSPGKPLTECAGTPSEVRALDYGYRRYWRPFLTLPEEELNRVPDQNDPTRNWRPAPKLLQGTIMPLFALALMFDIAAGAVAAAGSAISPAAAHLWIVGIVTSAASALVLLAAGAERLWRHRQQ